MTMAASYRQPFVKQKNSKTENSFFESAKKGKNTPYKIL